MRDVIARMATALSAEGSRLNPTGNVPAGAGSVYGGPPLKSLEISVHTDNLPNPPPSEVPSG